MGACGGQSGGRVRVPPNKFVLLGRPIPASVLPGAKEGRPVAQTAQAGTNAIVATQMNPPLQALAEEP